MSNAADFYRVLGVEPDATPDEIKKAYKKLAYDWHPDRNPDKPGAEERFKEINLAYAILGDAVRRGEYDREQSAGTFRNLDLDLDLDLQDILRRIFGPRRKRRKRGEDLKYHLTLSFEEAVRGTEAKIRVPRMVACIACDSEGVQTDRVCDKCEGAGRVERTDTLLVPVPSGVETGRRLRMKGFGNEGVAGGKAGELFVIVEIAEHPLLSRDGLDVVCTVPVTIAEAALGTQITVPTVSGSVRVKVPPGTQPDTELRLRERGVRHENGRVGDQRVKIQVVVPRVLTDELRRELETLQATLGRTDVAECADYDTILTTTPQLDEPQE